MHHWRKSCIIGVNPEMKTWSIKVNKDRNRRGLETSLKIHNNYVKESTHTYHKHHSKS
jgi:hypothetical protein